MAFSITMCRAQCSNVLIRTLRKIFRSLSLFHRIHFVVHSCSGTLSCHCILCVCAGCVYKTTRAQVDRIYYMNVAVDLSLVARHRFRRALYCMSL